MLTHLPLLDTDSFWILAPALGKSWVTHLGLFLLKAGGGGEVEKNRR